jgi:hypothetical protein
VLKGGGRRGERRRESRYGEERFFFSEMERNRRVMK